MITSAFHTVIIRQHPDTSVLTLNSVHYLKDHLLHAWSGDPPVDPCKPVAPLSPWRPVAPIGPCLPVLPVAPVSPVGPVAPDLPSRPVGPEIHR